MCGSLPLGKGRGTGLLRSSRMPARMSRLEQAGH
jgi:hypothetical protein